MTLELHLPTEADTARLGEDIAAILMPGDLLALSGEMGAGKSALARAVLRALAGDPALEVPSPTFTIVQTYEDGRVPALHADLYRLADPLEADELGLSDMLARGVVLVEWPERGALDGPSIRISLRERGEGRDVVIDAAPETLARIERSLEARRFLRGAGEPKAVRSPVGGDASARGYEIVTPGPDSALQGPLLLMDSPAMPDGPPVRDGLPYSRVAHLAEDAAPFVAIARGLSERGFRTPNIHAADLDRGFLLTEHLGSGAIVDANGAPIAERYIAVAQTLAAIHDRHWPEALPVAAGHADHTIPRFSRRAMLIEVELTLDWAFPRFKGRPVSEDERGEWLDAWTGALDAIADAETSLVLRDVQAPNIIWCAGKGHDRVGLIDFQDGLIGPAAYDVASLAQDARVDMPPALEHAVVDAYLTARERRDPLFETAYAVMSAQRASKLFGLWVRLDKRDGKPRFLKHMPRTRDYFARTLDHPALRDVAAWFERHALLERSAERLAA